MVTHICQTLISGFGSLSFADDENKYQRQIIAYTRLNRNLEEARLDNYENNKSSKARAALGPSATASLSQTHPRQLKHNLRLATFVLLKAQLTSPGQFLIDYNI